SNVTLDPDSAQNGQDQQQGPAPQGYEWPTCSTMGPQAPHAVTNNDTFPLHFYRMEFKRVDGDGIKDHWKEWYAWMLKPIPPFENINPKDPKYGPPLSKDFPYGLGIESYKSAPNNHKLRYEDDHVMLLEVTMRPGERENVHGHSYNSVFFRDTG